MRREPHDLVNGFTWRASVKGLVTLGLRTSLSTYVSVAPVLHDAWSERFRPGFGANCRTRHWTRPLDSEY